MLVDDLNLVGELPSVTRADIHLAQQNPRSGLSIPTSKRWSGVAKGDVEESPSVSGGVIPLGSSSPGTENPWASRSRSATMIFSHCPT